MSVRHSSRFCDRSNETENEGKPGIAHKYASQTWREIYKVSTQYKWHD